MHPWINKLVTGHENTQPVRQTQLVPVQTELENYKPANHNPFMVAMNDNSEAYRATYGINRPLKKPMFLGYRENKALYGGARLFILY